MKNVLSAAQHKRVQSMELSVFQFGGERTQRPEVKAQPWAYLYFCAADGTPLTKPVASLTGLGTWTCKTCHGHKAQRVRA